MKGLCIGSEQDIRNNSDGYVAFVRQGTDEAIIFQQYINIVLLPHFQRVREAQGLYTVSNMEVPEEHTVVSWSDGGLPQLKNTLSASIQEVYKLKNIKYNKHSAATSARQQPADKASTFRSQRKLMKGFLVNDFINLNNSIQIGNVKEALSHAKQK